MCRKKLIMKFTDITINVLIYENQKTNTKYIIFNS